MKNLIFTLSILFLFTFQAQAQNDDCEAYNDAFALFCLVNIPGCNAGTPPCDDATFDMVFGPDNYAFFGCANTPAGGGACNSLVDYQSLPVELVFFDAAIQENGIQLNWTTASEINNEGFYIEVSMAGAHWEELEFVKGNGTSELVNEYSFMHKNPTLGTNYFRLKQVDFDGAYEYSNINVAIWRGGTEDLELVIIPNPTTDQIVPVLPFEYQESRTVDYEIYNDVGVLVKSFPGTGKSNVKLPVHDLTSGTYTIISKAKKYVHTARFVKI